MLFVYRIAVLLCVLVSLAVTDVNAGNIHDPTKPWPKNEVAQSNSVQNDAKAFQLQGIMTRNGRKVAIISNQLVEQGDKVLGYFISQINTDHIVVVSAGTQRRIYVYE